MTQPKPWYSCWCQCVVTQPKPWRSGWCQCVVTQPKPWRSCWCQCVVTQPKPWCSCWCQCVVTWPKPRQATSDMDEKWLLNKTTATTFPGKRQRRESRPALPHHHQKVCLFLICMCIFRAVMESCIIATSVFVMTNLCLL